MNITRLNPLLWLVALTLLSAGCASTSGKIETRKQEKAEAYASLSPEMRALVDVGKIKIGMPADAVYVAWGKPSQVVASESPQGALTTWLYQATQLQEYRYWSYRPYYGRHSAPYTGATLESDYYPTSFLAGEVTFENGVVKQWRTLPAPPVR